MTHCESGGAVDTTGEFRFSWSYNERTYWSYLTYSSGRSMKKLDYQGWTVYCENLKEFFAQYPAVRWQCNSFEFIATCDNLAWVADEILRGLGGHVLADVTSLQQWIPGQGHMKLAYADLLKLT